MSPDITLSSLAEKALKQAKAHDSDLKCYEIYYSEESYLAIEIEENSIKHCEKGLDSGLSIRTAGNNGSLGFSFTNQATESSVSKMVKDAIKMTKAGTADPDFIDFPNHYDEYPSLHGLFDGKLTNLEIEDYMNFPKEMIDVCAQDEKAISQSADLNISITRNGILNSNGLAIEGKDTSCSVSSNIIVKDKLKKESAYGYDWQSVRFLDELNARQIALNALEDGKRNLNRIKIKSKKLPIILTPKGTISLILQPIASAVNAETFQYQRSFLVGKLNKPIGAPTLTIRDNALLDGAIGSAIFDGEGVPCQDKAIIKEGIFQQLLHNSYTAGKANQESSGNASRSAYSSTPSIGITNFMMSPGNQSKDELIKEVKEGILLDYTGDSPNISTGDFSGLILHGNVIRDGEVQESLNETMIAINLMDLFNQIDGISKEVRVYGSYHAPHVKIKDVQVLGSSS